MGKPNNSRSKGNKPNPSPVLSRHFFPLKQTASPTVSSAPTTPKMATAQDDQSFCLTKWDWEQSFQSFEAEFICRMNALLNPIVEKLEDINIKLTQVEQTAESAVELALTLQQDIQQLHRHENWATEKAFQLESRLHHRNLKLCGLPEGEEGTLFVVHWL